jgi:biopolymer transport protein ExbD
MASAFASAVPSQRTLASINITPLVDVMLVLLVIFMIAAPLMSRALPLELPQQAPYKPLALTPPDPIELRVDAAGDVYWNGDLATMATLPDLMRGIANADPALTPALQIDANGDADYAVIVKVMAAANAAGLQKVGFVRH